MKNSFKLFTATVILSLAGFTASAQNFRSISMLQSALSITVSNNFQYTNLQSQPVVANASTTNIVGLIYTNLLGNQVIVGVGDTTQLTTDAPFWCDRNGNPILVMSGYTNGTWLGAESGLTMNIHLLTGGSGANSAVNFTFAPVFDGVHEATAAGDRWTVGVTANTTSQVNLSTNVPMWKWPGCKFLRLETIVNTDTDASSQVVVDGISLNGFVP